MQIGKKKRTEEREDTAKSTLGGAAIKNELLPGLSALLLFRVIFAIILLVVGAVVKTSPAVVVVLQIIGGSAAGYDLVIKAANDVMHRDFTGENLPVVLAALLCFFIGRGSEGVIVLLILQAAYVARGYALPKIRDILISGVSLTVSDEKIPTGERLRINGVDSLIPTDCVVVEGTGTVDMSFITGNRTEITVRPGMLIPGGSLCTGGQFVAAAGRTQEDSVATTAAKTIERGFEDETSFEEKHNGFLKFLPAAMLLIAAIITIVCAANAELGFTEGLARAVTVLAVASPVTVMLGVPLSYLSAMTAARQAGAVVGDAEDMDKAASVKTMVFDKTGTITGMNYRVSEIKSDKMDSMMLLKVAAHAVSRSKSVEARAVVSAYDGTVDGSLIQEYKEFPGRGIEATMDGIHVLFGTEAFLGEYGVSVPKQFLGGSSRFMAFNRQYAGHMVLTETVNSDIYDTVSALGELGVDRIAMVSSASRESDRAVAGSLGIAEYFAECSQMEKLQRISELKGKTDGRSALAYVGCGEDIDPMCAAADLSFALNCMDTNYVPVSADVYVLGTSAAPVPKTISIAKKNKLWLVLEVAVLLAVKLLIVILAATGVAPVWFGMVLDVCLSLLVTMDALRPSRFRKKGSAEA